jgi:PAS domain S-box-containing protein
MNPVSEKQSDTPRDLEIAQLHAKISELTEANKALINTQILVEAMLENIPDRIYFKDTQSRFVKLSKALAKRLGVTDPDDAVGKTDFDFHPPEKASEYFEDEQRIIQTGEPIINKIEKYVMPSGKPSWMSTTKVPLRSPDGVVVGIVGINRDITEMKLAEEKIDQELRDVSRQAGMAELATGVLHNVGNVLNSVNVAAGVLSDRLNHHQKASGLAKLSKLLAERQNDLADFLSTDERGRQIPAYLQQLSEYIGKEQEDMRKELNELVMNVEHIKEIVSTQQSYARVLGMSETVHLPDVIEDALKIHGGAYERHGIKLIREYEDVPTMTIEKHKVLQIIINFLSNAKYACDAGNKDQKTVTVRIKKLREDRVKLEVEDNGIGISPDNLMRIFTQGFTTRKGGHGFGLHSGTLVAKELGGELTVKSNGIGCGATFALEMPIVAAPERAKT